MAHEIANNGTTAADVRPETKAHNEVVSFANGQGPILSRADQALAFQNGKNSADHGSHDLPSNEELLQQLRRDARTYEHKALHIRDGLSSPDRYSAVNEIYDSELGILRDKDKVAKYTPEQLKDIGDLANAANDPAREKEIMKRFTDPQKFLDLQEGLRLEEERRGGKIDLGAGTHTNDQGQVIPYLSITNNKTNAFKTVDGPAHTIKRGESQGFELNVN